jgi:outer membrane protein TolC
MKRLSFLIFCILPLDSAVSADAFTTLQQAVHHTIDQNFSLRASAQQLATAEAQIGVAESARSPEIVFRYALLASDNPLDAFAASLNTRTVTAEDFDPGRLNDPDVSTLFSGAVALRYSVYNGGRTEADIDSAQGTSDAIRLRHSRFLQRLAFNTMRAYYASQAAEYGVSIAKDAEAAAQRHVGTTRQLVRQDRTVKSDQLTAEVNWSAFKSLTTQSATGRKLAYNRLKVAMGMPQTQPILVPQLSLKPIAVRLQEISRYEQQAFESRLDLEALKAALETARAQIRSAEARLRPRVDLVADATLYQDDPIVDEPSWRVMGMVSQDLYTGGRTRSGVDAARSRADTIRYQLESLRQEILGEVRDAYDRVQESQARLEIAKGNVAKARRNVSLISERYGQGRTILIDLLGAEQRLVAARNEELSAQQSLMIHLAALRLATGDLDPHTTFVDQYATQ